MGIPAEVDPHSADDARRIARIAQAECDALRHAERILSALHVCIDIIGRTLGQVNDGAPQLERLAGYVLGTRDVLADEHAIVTSRKAALKELLHRCKEAAIAG